MPNARELNQIAQAENAAQYLEKLQQKKEHESNINSHVIRIGKRDPTTGKHEVIHPGGGITISGNKTSNASLAYGSQVRTLPNSNYGTSDFVVNLGSKNRENNPQPTIEPKTRKQKAIPLIPIKILFSVVKDGAQVFYIGGDRDTPQEVLRIPTNRGVNPYLENTGKGLDDWIFAVNHWDAPTATATGGHGSGVNACQVISPTIPHLNWELTNIPSDMSYVGSGVWITPTMATPSTCIVVDLETAIAREWPEPNRNMAAWCANHGYNFPLDLVSSPSGFSYNIASAIVWNKKLDIFNGRTTVIFSTVTGQILSDYTSVLQYGIAPCLGEDKLITRLESKKSYEAVLISPDRKYVLYRQHYDQFQYDPSNVNFKYEKSILLTQTKSASDSQSKQIIKESDLSIFNSSAYLDYFVNGFYIKDPIGGWNPRNSTLYHSGKENTTLKCFYVPFSNFWLRLPTLPDLEAITKVDPQTGKGGITVYEFIESEPNQIIVKELVDKRIILEKVKKLGYEEDPTLRIWSINYYPEKPFD